MTPSSSDFSSQRSYISPISSLASRLRRAASNLSDEAFSGQSSCAAARLAFDSDYASDLARSARSFTHSVLSSSPSSRICHFLENLSSDSSRDEGLDLNREHRDLLRVGAAGEVLTDLTSSGRLDTVDHLHGYLDSLNDTLSTQPDDDRLIGALRSRLPSYHSHTPGSPPPSYSAVESSALTSSTVPMSSLCPPSSAHHRVISDIAWTRADLRGATWATSQPRRANVSSIAELESAPVYMVAQPVQTSLARSVKANSTTNLSYPRQVSIISAELPSVMPSPRRVAAPSQYSLGPPLSRVFSGRQPSRKSASSAAIASSGLEPRPPRKNKMTRISLNPCPTPGWPSNPSHDHVTTRWSADSYPAVPALRPGPKRTPHPSQTISTIANAINDLSCNTPSHLLLRAQAEMTRSSDRVGSAVRLAMTTDALSRIPSSPLVSILSLARASRRLNESFRDGSAIQEMMCSASGQSLNGFYRAAELLKGLGSRQVRPAELDDLITRLQEYRDRLRGSR
ncbi:hypothetical protein BD324DRAFT_649036 [Kockovaella imperatae]|uniref:Uncharacterized protein n=1 Tax=Kockovaella imperatae TaxID=4999 RepID=A0A1Y1UN46_9TREE|nr:hypothetical protein BD324DRAFT_649036 [Kockovaella imperatae]ORX38937.1 hypothetical protein BD324DRAFT_649036 [Kockovaella imperatae]